MRPGLAALAKEKSARFLGESPGNDSPEQSGRTEVFDQDAQPGHPRLDKLSPSYHGSTGIPKSGNGHLAASLVLGQTSALRPVSGLDRQAILAPAGQEAPHVRGRLRREDAGRKAETVSVGGPD